MSDPVALGEPRRQTIQEDVDQPWRLPVPAAPPERLGRLPQSAAAVEATGQDDRSQCFEVRLSRQPVVELFEPFGSIEQQRRSVTHSKITGPMTEEQKAERREVVANNKAWDSATTVRRTWLTTFFARKTAPPDGARWIAETLAEGNRDVRKATGEVAGYDSLSTGSAVTRPAVPTPLQRRISAARSRWSTGAACS